MPDKELIEKPDFPVGDSGTLEAMRSVTVMVDRGSVTGTYEKLELRLSVPTPVNIATREDYDVFIRATENLLEMHRDQFVKGQMEKAAGRTVPQAKPAPAYAKPPPASSATPPRTQKGIEWIPWKSKPDIGARANIDGEEADSYAKFLKMNGHVSNQTKLDTEDGWGCWYAEGSGEYGPCLMRIRMNASRGD